jgi:hypothetical protein
MFVISLIVTLVVTEAKSCPQIPGIETVAQRAQNAGGPGTRNCVISLWDTGRIGVESEDNIEGTSAVTKEEENPDEVRPGRGLVPASQ